MAVRFSDVDPLWHLNNVRLLEFYQESRLLLHAALGSGFDVVPANSSRILVAHQSIDYLQEVKYPSVIRMGVGILKIGTSSYTIAMAMFQNDLCVGLASTVLVYVDQGRPSPLPAALIEPLRKNLLPEHAR